MRCASLYLRISQQKISLLRFLLEGYDGLGILSTIESKEGLVRLLVPAPRYNELLRFLAGSAHELS